MENSLADLKIGSPRSLVAILLQLWQIKQTITLLAYKPSHPCMRIKIYALPKPEKALNIKKTKRKRIPYYVQTQSILKLVESLKYVSRALCWSWDSQQTKSLLCPKVSRGVWEPEIQTQDFASKIYPESSARNLLLVSNESYDRLSKEWVWLPSRTYISLWKIRKTMFQRSTFDIHLSIIYTLLWSIVKEA